MFTLISGGAIGADATFEQLAETNGHNVIIYRPEEMSKLETEQYDSFLVYINNKYLSRIYPSSNEYVNKLLRRDAMVGLNVDILYAVSTLDENGRIKGGTAWACYSFISKFYNGFIPLFLFDQDKNQWFQVEVKEDTINYHPANSPKVPPGLKYGGIGTRELNDNGIKAIRELYKTK